MKSFAVYLMNCSFRRSILASASVELDFRLSAALSLADKRCETFLAVTILLVDHLEELVDGHALVFKEKNLRSKALDLALVLLGMVFLYLGSR